MSIVSKNKDSYIKDVLLNLKYMESSNYDAIYDEYNTQLEEFNKQFYFKHNVKLFNYFENNVIINIMRFLDLISVFKFSIISKKYFSIMGNLTLPYIVNLKRGEHFLIKTFPNINFSYKYNGRKTLTEARKYKGVYKYTLMGYPNKYVSFLSESKMIDVSNSDHICDYTPFTNANVLIMKNIWSYREQIRTNFNMKLKKLFNSTIQHLDLSCTPITNNGLKNFKNLKTLILLNCKYLEKVDIENDEKLET